MCEANLYVFLLCKFFRDLSILTVKFGLRYMPVFVGKHILGKWILRTRTWTRWLNYFALNKFLMAFLWNINSYHAIDGGQKYWIYLYKIRFFARPLPTYFDCHRVYIDAILEYARTLNNFILRHASLPQGRQLYRIHAYFSIVYIMKWNWSECRIQCAPVVVFKSKKQLCELIYLDSLVLMSCNFVANFLSF